MSASIFQKIDRLDSELGSYRPLSESLNRAIQEKLRIEWTYNSNAIEGNTLTRGETAFYLREGLTSEGKPLKDYLEARNHAEAIDYLNEVVRQEKPMTESFVKALHSLLMKDTGPLIVQGGHGQKIRKPIHTGEYKKETNHVLTLSGRVHEYVDPLHVQEEMEKLLSWLDKKKIVHAVEQAVVFHYRFVAIHPFDDGNGRMARLLMNLILMRAGYIPCVIRNEKRRMYLETLEHADATGDESAFVNFVAEELLETYRVILGAIRGEDTELESIPAQKTVFQNRAQRHARILQLLQESGSPLSVGQVEEILGDVKRPTLKQDLRQLTEEGEILQSGKGRGTVYSLEKKS